MYAVICGGSKGIGRAVAESLALRKYNLMLNARNKEDLLKTAEEIRKKYDVEVKTYAGNLSEKAVCEGLSEEACDKFGRIDALLINAGGPKPGELADVTDEDWQHAFEITLMPAVRLIRSVLPFMRNQHYGRVVAIESISVKQPVENLILSNAIRPAVVGLFKTMALREAENNITFNVVGPGATNTKRLESLFEARAKASGKTVEEITQLAKESIPMGRFARTGEIGELAAFLMTKDSMYVTGQVILADGGAYSATW